MAFDIFFAGLKEVLKKLRGILRGIYFFSGLHICLADTLNELPEELLAFTVDYIQLEKPSNERSANLTVHHMQLDDFGDEDSS